MKKVYISLPITGCDEAVQRQKAAEIAKQLRDKGYKPLSPFEIYAGEKPTYADYLCCDLRALADCDTVFFCDGWIESRGCRIERNFASEFNKEIIYEIDKL